MTRLLLALFLLTGCATVSTTRSAPQAPFNVKVTGQGRPMLFIPGLSSPGDVWDQTVAHYAKDHECHVLTLAGFGGAAPIDGALLPQVHDALAAYIRAHHLEAPVIVGHSLGGFMGLWLAETDPDVVGQLVIVDSAPSLAALNNPDATALDMKLMADGMREQLRQADKGTRAKAARMISRGMTIAPENQDKVMQWSLASDADTVADAAYFVMSTDLRKDLAKVKAPTLVIGTWLGYQPYLTRADLLERFTTQYRACTTCTVTLDDAARHFVMLDDEAGLEARIDSFLSQRTAAR